MAVPKKSLDNLKKRKPWTKETAPRNGGRPATPVNLINSLRDALTPDVVNKIVASITKKAMAGDIKSQEFIANRLHGLPTASIRVDNQPTVTIEHSVLNFNSREEFENFKQNDAVVHSIGFLTAAQQLENKREDDGK